MPPQGLSSSSAFSSQHPLRVGVIGCAKVLFKAWPAIHVAGHRVTYIGCRDTARAQATATEIIAKLSATSAMKQPEGTCPGGRASGGGGHRAGEPGQAAVPMPRFGPYASVIHSAEVDVVYITIPVALRGPYVRACIEAGKHVVDEKPAAASAAQLHSWLEGLSLRRLLFMDGTMLTHSDRMHMARDKARELGGVRHIEATFGFLASESFLQEDIRCKTNLEPHGALGDLGWYAVRWILHMVDFAVPTHVSGVITAVTPPAAAAGDGERRGGGAISAFAGHLTFPPAHADPSAAPITASFACSFHAAYQQCVKAFTSGGVVEVQGAINPTGEDRPHFIVRTVAPADAAAACRRPTVKVEKVYSSAAEVDGSQQAVAMWSAVGSSLVRLGTGEPLLMDPERGKDFGRNAYLTQLVLDKLLESATLTTATDGDGATAQPPA